MTTLLLFQMKYLIKWEAVGEKLDMTGRQDDTGSKAEAERLFSESLSSEVENIHHTFVRFRFGLLWLSDQQAGSQTSNGLFLRKYFF